MEENRCQPAVAPLPLHTCLVSSACALRPHMSLLTTHSSVCRNVQLVSKLGLQQDALHMHTRGSSTASQPSLSLHRCR